MSAAKGAAAAAVGAAVGEALWRWWSRTGYRRMLALAGWRDETIVNRATFDHDGLDITGDAVVGNLTMQPTLQPVIGYCGNPIPGQWSSSAPGLRLRAGTLRCFGTLQVGRLDATGTAFRTLSLGTSDVTLSDASTRVQGF